MTRASNAPDGQAWLTTAEARAAKIELATVASQPIDDAITTSGRVVFDDMRVAHVFSPVTGKVVRIDAQLGDHVKKGQRLAVLESPDMGSAASDMRRAEADLVAAEHDLKRRKDLYERSAGSKADLESAEDTFRKAKAELERSRMKGLLLRSNGVEGATQTYTLVSPIDGEVVTRQVNPGIEVQGQYSGASAIELFTVGDADHVWVMADLYEAESTRVKIGAEATTITSAYGERSFRGTVDWVSQTLDPTTRIGAFRFVVDNPERLLKPEMYVTVRVAVDRRTQLAVPRSSVVSFGTANVVFTEIAAPEGQARFERTPITVDDVGSKEWLVVLHGVDAGQRVVATGAGAVAARL